MPVTSAPSPRLPLLLGAAVLLVMGWSFIAPYDQLTWWMESLPAIVGVILLTLTFTRFPLTPMLYVLIAIHCIILLVGAHYTYARVPLFDELKPIMGWERNHYDRLGHLAQGFVPAIIGRELLLRTSPLQRGTWLFVLLVLSCLGVSALYELIEWLAALLSEEASASFLGTQGDVWDTQSDMALAGLGAIAALLLLSRGHDAQLKKLGV